MGWHCSLKTNKENYPCSHFGEWICSVSDFQLKGAFSVSSGVECKYPARPPTFIFVFHLFPTSLSLSLFLPLSLISASDFVRANQQPKAICVTQSQPSDKQQPALLLSVYFWHMTIHRIVNEEIEIYLKKLWAFFLTYVLLSFFLPHIPILKLTLVSWT